MFVCALFLSGLWDTELKPVVMGTVFAPQPPTPAEERDGHLTLRAVDGATCAADDAGASADCASAQPVVGATARLYLQLGDRFYAAGEGVTGDDGVIEFTTLPRGVTWLLVEAPGFARASAQRVVEGLEASPQLRRAEVVLQAAHELAVRVEDEVGEPIVAATVLVTAADWLPYGVLTSATGVARFDRLGAPPWSVKASARGYESVTKSGVNGRVTLTLRRLGTLSVRVIDGRGAPVPEATVHLSGAALWPARQARTDALGVTRIAGLLGGAYDLRAFKGAAVSLTRFGHQLGRGEDSEVVLTLMPGRMVTVQVTGGAEEGAPIVAGADVVLTEYGVSSFPLQGTTGADGSVTLGPIAPGPATVSARAAGFVARGGVPLPEPLDGPVRVALLKGATLMGRVVDTRDRPVDGASIEIVGTDASGMPVAETPGLIAYRDAHFAWALAGPSPLIPAGELGVMPGPIPPIPREGPMDSLGPHDAAELAARAADYTPWVTSLSGEFTARPVTPGRVRALVRHPAYVEGLSEVVVLGPGGQAEVVVVLSAGGSLQGKVVDAGGYGVAGARVDVVARVGTLQRTTLTASDGSFAFASLPEDVELSVYRPDDFDRIAVARRLVVPEGGRAELTVTLPEPRGAITLTVEGDGGQAVALAEVSVLSLDPAVPLRQTRFTDSAGELEVEDAEGLKLQLIVSAPGYAQHVQTLAAAPQRVTVDLQRAVQVTGRVTAVRGRTLVSGALVVLVTSGAQQSAVTDAHGEYQLSEVTPGAARLMVSHPDYARAEQRVDIERGSRADSPVELPEVDLRAAGDVSGVVVDAEGEPVAGARVAEGVAPAFLPVGTLPAGVAVTDAEGRFTLRGLPAGSLQLAAYAAEVGRGAVSVEVQEGREISEVRIALTEAAGEVEPGSSGSVAVTLGERDEGGGTWVVVVHVAPGSEAERAGLLAGDLLLRVDGARVSDMTEARARLSGPVRGDVVLEVRREGEARALRVRREQVRR